MATFLLHTSDWVREIEGTYALTDGGVLTIRADGEAERIYSPTGWLYLEAASEDGDAAVLPFFPGS